MSNQHQEHWHRRLLEGSAGLMAGLTTVLISIGGLVEIVPMFTDGPAGPDRSVSIEVYTPLEVAGRDIYTREGCYTCHSQMVRPFRSETMRFGEWSRAWEYQYDRPFLLGSRRIGPDLHRLGGKYPDLWHVRHMRNPKDIEAKSIMPAYPWMLTNPLDFDGIQRKVDAMVMLGVPYGDAVTDAPAMARTQAQAIAQSIASQGGPADLSDKEIVAMVAYLQRLGRDVSAPAAAGAAGAP